MVLGKAPISANIKSGTVALNNNATSQSATVYTCPPGKIALVYATGSVSHILNLAEWVEVYFRNQDRTYLTSKERAFSGANTSGITATLPSGSSVLLLSGERLQVGKSSSRATSNGGSSVTWYAHEISI